MTTEQLDARIKELEQMIFERNKTIGEMEGDIKGTVSAFLRILEAFQINPEEFKGDEQSIMRKLPGLMNKITVSFVGGNFSNVQADFMALAPLLQKYKHLMPADEQ